MQTEQYIDYVQRKHAKELLEKLRPPRFEEDLRSCRMQNLYLSQVEGVTEGSNNRWYHYIPIVLLVAFAAAVVLYKLHML